LIENIWQQQGYGPMIRELLSIKTLARSYRSIYNLGLFYIDQLLDGNRVNLITWSRLKEAKIGRNKGRKPQWFAEIEQKLLKNNNSRHVIEEFRKDSENRLAVRLFANRLSKDKRKQEWLLINQEDCNTLIVKVNPINYSRALDGEEVDAAEGAKISKCQGCSKNKSAGINECEFEVKVNSVIGAIPKVEIKEDKGYPNFTKEFIHTRFRDNTESRTSSEQQFTGMVPSRAQIFRKQLEDAFFSNTGLDKSQAREGMLRGLLLIEVERRCKAVIISPKEQLQS
ncbi:10526_t:CDS:2, partial [Gigaspora rosea]